MGEKEQVPVQIVDVSSVELQEHPRFRGIYMGKLLTAADNALASVNTVQVPPGEIILPHGHPAEVETVFVIKGQSLLTLNDREVPFSAGQIVAIPIGLEHSLRNVGSETVELLTFFTPALG